MKTDLEIINKLFLELSQITTAKTKRELDLEANLKMVCEWMLDFTRDISDCELCENAPYDSVKLRCVDCEDLRHHVRHPALVIAEEYGK